MNYLVLILSIPYFSLSGSYTFEEADLGNELQCNIDGLCLGEVIGTYEDYDEVTCLYQCTLVDGCTWYSFERNVGTCLLLKDCPSLNEELNYISGQVECQLPSSTVMPVSSSTSSPVQISAKLLVVSGYYYDMGYVNKSEVIDLMDSMNECQPWANHPTGTYLAAGAFINQKLHICGGYNTNNYSTFETCFLISPTSAEPTLNLTIGSDESAAINFQGHLWYTGGENLDTGSLMRTEMLSDAQVFPGPDLPYPVRGHCIVKVSEETVLITGGATSGLAKTNNKQTWFYNANGWTRGPDMIESRERHGCSSFWLNGVEIIAVSPGYGSSGTGIEFLNLNQENPQWIQGASLPDYYFDNRGHQMVSNNEILFYINTNDNIFLQLDCQSSLEDCHWNSMDQKLEFPRVNAVVSLIPDNLSNCTNSN